MTAAPSAFDAVLLAAGEGSRLGRVPKSLLCLEGGTLIERQVLALLKAGVQRIIIVTGYFYLEIEAEVREFLEKITLNQSNKKETSFNICDLYSGYINNQVEIVRNPTPDQGQQSSVLVGLRALLDLPTLNRSQPEGADDHQNRGLNNHDSSPILIVLVDQPLMNETDFQMCVTAFHRRPSGCSIVFPVVAGQRGNPVAFSREVIEKVLESGQTCREYIDHHREQTHRFTCDNDHFIVDIDQEQDRLRFEQRTGLSLSVARAVSKPEPHGAAISDAGPTKPRLR